MAKRKIPSRKFPKTKKKIPSRKFPKSQRKIPSRKFAQAPADKQPDPQVALGRPTNEDERQVRVATLAAKMKSVLPASGL
jgi:hypothetical protein